MRIELTVNGDLYRRETAPDATLLDVLRDELGLTGTKWGCKTGDCGACTVLVDGEPVASCIQLARQVEGRELTTIEGLDSSDGLSDVQAAFVRNGAAQCGFCTPGVLMSAAALLARNPEPSRAEIALALSGNLCRCTGYTKIFEAVELAARRLREAAR